MKTLVHIAVSCLLAAVVCGCTRTIAFDDSSGWRYSIDAPKRNAGVVVVIDEATLNSTYSFRSAMAGLANRWVAQYGLMLKQVADVELPQMFQHYETRTAYAEPTQGTQRLTLAMTVPNYKFADTRASVTVHTVAYGKNKSVLFEKSYSEEGNTQGGKMFAAGAFGLKSAVRQSTLDAYRKVFASLRADLERTLQSRPPE